MEASVISIGYVVVSIAGIMFAIYNINRGRPWGLLGLILPVLVFLSPIFYEFPGFNGELVVSVTADGSSCETYPWGTFEFGKNLFILPNAIKTSSSVTPITDNPKARHITYEVSVKITKPERFFLSSPEIWDECIVGGNGDKDLLEKWRTSNQLSRVVRYWLYEFNNANSQKLAELYNPLEPSQVEKLEQMLLPWLNDKIGPQGLLARSVSFTVE